MQLDADAKAIADMAASIPPFHQLGIDGAREIAAMADAIPVSTDIAEVTERTVPTPHGPVPVRVYHPEPGAQLPALIYMHGGGWSIGGLGTADGTCRALAEGARCVVVSVDYRLAPEHKFPAAFHDVDGVARWLVDNAGQIGVDGQRLAIGGDSCGANLAAAVSINARDNAGPPFVCQLLAYPATEYAVPRPSWTENAQSPMLCIEDVLWYWDQYLRNESDREDPRATPANASSLAGLPPALILTAEYDPIRDDAEAYGKLLAEAGTPVTVNRYPGVFHGFFTMPTLVRAQEALADAVEHLSIAFGNSPQGLSA